MCMNGHIAISHKIESQTRAPHGGVSGGSTGTPPVIRSPREKHEKVLASFFLDNLVIRGLTQMGHQRYDGHCVESASSGMFSPTVEHVFFCLLVWFFSSALLSCQTYNDLYVFSTGSRLVGYGRQGHLLLTTSLSTAVSHAALIGCSICAFACTSLCLLFF